MSRNELSFSKALLAGALAVAASSGCGGGGGGGGGQNLSPGFGSVASDPGITSASNPPQNTTTTTTTTTASSSGGSSSSGSPAPASGSSPSAPSSGGSSSGGSTGPVSQPSSPAAPSAPVTGLAGVGPSSGSFMTEEEEVAWINSLGWNVTVADLRASYSKFVVKAIDPNMNVLWDTETDMLRNYFRLYQRTGYKPFLDQAKVWHDFLVNTYSHPGGGHNTIEQSHVYMMGLVDWYVVNHDQPTLDAINRIIDFIKTIRTDLFETRALARPLQCLCYYVEKIGTRSAEVQPVIQALLQGVEQAVTIKSFKTMRVVSSMTPLNVGGVPSGVDLRKLFPADATIFNGTNTYPVANHQGAGLYQDCMLLHALRVAARVRHEPHWSDVAAQIAAAWEPLIDHPAWDTAGTTNLGAPYYILPEASDLRAFIAYEAPSPLYITQFTPFVANASKKKAMAQQSLLRQYGNLQPIREAERSGKPYFFPWQTWQAGYFLLQK